MVAAVSIVQRSAVLLLTDCALVHATSESGKTYQILNKIWKPTGVMSGRV